MAFERTISNEDTAALPSARFEGRIVVVENDRQVAAACRDLSSQSIIGFDTETRPSFTAGVVNKVALLQLSTHERCYLIRLCRTRLHNSILKILSNPRIVKIGADVAGDLRSLRQLRHFRDGGFVDLQTLAPAWGIEEKSLRKLSAIVLGQRVSKAQRLSNWEAATLTPKQQLYAATDAWVCTEIYRRLLETPKAVPAPPAPASVAAAGAAPSDSGASDLTPSDSGASAGAEPHDSPATARRTRRASRRGRSGSARRRARKAKTEAPAARTDSDERNPKE